MTGVVTIKDDRKSIKIYLKGGHVVFADGIDKDRQLLKEISAKKKLGREQIDELKRIKEKEPQFFGKALIEQKLISQAIWNKFLEIKVKHILTAAFEMDAADLGFRRSELDILPLNFIDYNIIQLLLDVIRGLKNPEQLKKQIPGDDEAFVATEEAEAMKGNVPLSPSEQTVLSLLGSKKTVEQIIAETGFDQEGVHKILYLLLCFGLIDGATDESGEKVDNKAIGEIINLYLDLLRIIETNFRKEVGKEFEKAFDSCRRELKGESKELFLNLNLSKENQDSVVKEISRPFQGRDDPAEVRLSLLSSFNKLVYLLILKMKKILGIGLTEMTLDEMMNILDYVEKYRQDKEMMNYVKGNLTDYLRQIKS